jgi:proteic killer suppression protein
MQHLYDGVDSRAIRATLPASPWPATRRKLEQLDAASALGEMAVPPGNRLERLRGDRVGQHSIRVNARYRVCFRWEGIDAHDVEIVDYHR